jgi:hypothetical protein
MSSGSSVESLEGRLTDLTRQLNGKDAELDEAVADFIDASIDDLDEDIEATNKNIKEGLRQRVERIKQGARDRKQRLKEKVDAAKQKPKDDAKRNAEQALDAMEQDLSEGDLESAHVNRWVANVWLRASK